jgi:arginyl-tRNA synthetase
MDVYVALSAWVLVVHAVSIPVCEPDVRDGARRKPQPMKTPLDELREAVLAGVRELARDGAGEGRPGAEAAPDKASGGRSAAGRAKAITLERPPKAELGDYATNAALLLAPSLQASPREVAERLGAGLAARLGGGLCRYEIAGPGFLNLFVADTWLRSALAGMLAAGDSFGSGGVESPECILVEFVSANPTGPMHVGHARNAAYGDSLARVLAFHGHEVEREFYVNDAGSQVRALGESIHALARGEKVPENGYRGEYVHELSRELADAAARDPAELGHAAVEAMIAHMRDALHAFAVQGFDHWQYESALHAGDPSPVEQALAMLAEHGHTYTSEGALWLRSSEYGDDKDRVLVRANGEHTYFASDIAYHQNKRERGFGRQIDVWGADHHGYLARMRAAYAALGGDPAHLEMLTMQLVHLVRRGERTQMSKRSGEFVTLGELIAEIGVDAARWFLLSRSHDTTIDLDLDLAREQSKENPVYYVQYAHARIVSVLGLAGAQRVAQALAEVAGKGEGLHEAERGLIKRLLAFPGEIGEAAKRRAPHRIATYALELAQDFTTFYESCRIVGIESAESESLRLALAVATRRTIARCLDLLGVNAPEKM